jgi:hypothetical protein
MTAGFAYAKAAEVLLTHFAVKGFWSGEAAEVRKLAML